MIFLIHFGQTIVSVKFYAACTIFQFHFYITLKVLHAVLQNGFLKSIAVFFYLQKRKVLLKEYNVEKSFNFYFSYLFSVTALCLRKTLIHKQKEIYKSDVKTIL